MPRKIAKNGQQQPDLSVWPDRPKRGPQLNTLSDMTSFAARIIREVYTQRLDPRTGSKIVYMLDVLREFYEIKECAQLVEKLLRRHGAIKPHETIEGFLLNEERREIHESAPGDDDNRPET